MKRKVIYSFNVVDKVEAELPQQLKDAFYICGWNAFGIYELVAEKLKEEKTELKRQQKKLTRQ